jgi:hypothetical protein
VKSIIKKKLSSARIGYVPLSESLNQPGDRRRFIFYAKSRNLSFEIADPSESYDVVILTQNADLTVWSGYDLGGAKVVYDLIDSYLVIPKTNIKGWLRGPAKYLSGQARHLYLNHWKAIGSMCDRADAVICSTKEQQADIYEFCANVHIILDAQEEVVRKIKNNYTCLTSFRLVWEGLPQNLESLKLIAPVLEELSLKHRIEFHIITDPYYKHFLGRYWSIDSREIVRRIHSVCVFHEWNRDTLADIICDSDLAVIPIDLNDLFARGKPENKLLLFWRMGMPVLVSATPSYSRTMRAAGLNDAVSSNEAWLEKLSAFIQDESLRERAALLGKTHVDGYYSSISLCACWDQMFESLGFSIY